MKYLIKHMTAFRCQMNENEWNCHSLVPLNLSEQLIDFIKPVSSLWHILTKKANQVTEETYPGKKPPSYFLQQNQALVDQPFINFLHVFTAKLVC